MALELVLALGGLRAVAGRRMERVRLVSRAYLGEPLCEADGVPLAVGQVAVAAAAALALAAETEPQLRARVGERLLDGTRVEQVFVHQLAEDRGDVVVQLEVRLHDDQRLHAELQEHLADFLG